MYLLNKWSKQEDAEGGTKYAVSMEKLSAQLSALRRDARYLRRRYRLLRNGEAVTAVPKGRLRRWLGL